MENTVVYRDEKAGELQWLSRVRARTQDDAHVSARLDQIEEEFASIMTMIRDMYTAFDLEWRAVLSFRDGSDKYLGDESRSECAKHHMCRKGVRAELHHRRGRGSLLRPLRSILWLKKMPWGESGNLTEQLDFLQPERFDLEYTDDQGEKQRPVMIHKALR